MQTKINESELKPLYVYRDVVIIRRGTRCLVTDVFG
jgi:hypothetical protein